MDRWIPQRKIVNQAVFNEYAKLKIPYQWSTDKNNRILFMYLGYRWEG